MYDEPQLREWEEGGRIENRISGDTKLVKNRERTLNEEAEDVNTKGGIS